MGERRARAGRAGDRESGERGPETADQEPGTGAAAEAGERRRADHGTGTGTGTGAGKWIYATYLADEGE